MDLYFYISKIATPLIVPSNIFVLLLIIFFYTGFIKNRIFFRKCFIIFFFIFSSISIFPIGHNLIFFFLEKDFYSSKIPSKIDYIFVPSGSINRIIFPSNFFIFSLVFLFYFGIFKNKIFFKKIFFLIFFIFSSVGILPIGNILVYQVLEKNYFDVKVPKDISYIFVPAGGEDRIITAMNIKNEYKLDNVKIIYSTGRPSLNKNKSIDTEEIFTKNLISNFKINSDDIIFLPEARNTSENFILLNNYLNKMNINNPKIFLVTHGYHIKRCLIFAKKYDLKITAYASRLTTKSYSSGLVNFYQHIDVLSNFKMFDLFIKEMISSIFAKIL